jgi:hypothetical protein
VVAIRIGRTQRNFTWTLGRAKEQPATEARWRSLLIIGPCLILIILHVTLALMRNRPLIFADEAGYIGNARYLAGGLPIKLLKSVAYSPGYSLLITPLFWLGLSPAHTYQAILIANGLLLSTCYVSLVYWVRWVLSDDSRYAYLIAFATSLYPAFLVQPLFAMSESAIIAISSALPLSAYWLVRSKKAWAGVLFGFLVAFLYAVHPRYLGTIGVAVAGIAALGVARVLPRRALVASLLTLGTGVILGRQLTAFTNEASSGHTIDAGAKLSKLPTTAGIYNLLIEAMGQFWYLVVASYGLAVLGLIGVIALGMRPAADSPRRASPAWNALIFTVGSAAVGFGVSSLFLSGASRVDHFIYGRYNEGVVAPFIATGLWSLTQLGRAWWSLTWRALFVALSGTVLAALLLWGRGVAWEGRPNLANVLAIVPQLQALSENDLLGISLLAAGGYLAVALASLWRPWLGIGLLAAIFSFIGYHSHLYFLGMQAGRAQRQVLYDRIATMPGVDRISYDASYFDPVSLFFGQYFLPHTEFDFFESDRGEQPKSPYFIGRQKWARAKEFEPLVISKDKLGFTLWGPPLGGCCPANDPSLMSFGSKPVPGVAEEGFYNPENWPTGPARWTNGDARLWIPIKPSDLATSHLLVDIASVGPSANRVSLYANGNQLFRGKIAKGRSTLVFPLSDVPADDKLDVKIESDTFVPHDHSDSEDMRQLGVALHSIRVMRECCLLEHNPFSPAKAPQ